MLSDVDTRPTVLLTGFGPFPGVPVNASGTLACRAVRRARRAYPDLRFVASILPTEWRRAPDRISALHKRYRPALALHFGVAAGAECIRLEAKADNICRPSPDAADKLPLASTLCVDGPAQHLATIEIEKIKSGLESEAVPCTISHDAGGYLCNAVLYRSLVDAPPGCQVGFVHIPVDLSSPPLDLHGCVAAVLNIIATALEKAKFSESAA